MTMDVSRAIEPKSDQQNADDYLAGPETVKIKSVEVRSTSEQPVSIHLYGKDGKPWKPSKTALRCLVSIWGADANKWKDLSLTLYNDPEVTWGGAKVGGIRVSHMEGLTSPRTLMLTKTRGKRGATVIKPLTIESAAPSKRDPDATKESAREAAKRGKEAFTKWWRDNVDVRDDVKDIMDELRKLTEDAGNESQDQS